MHSCDSFFWAAAMHVQLFKVGPFLLLLCLKVQSCKLLRLRSWFTSNSGFPAAGLPDKLGGGGGGVALCGITREFKWFRFGKQSPKSSHRTYLKAHQSDLGHHARAGVFLVTLKVFPFWEWGLLPFLLCIVSKRGNLDLVVRHQVHLASIAVEPAWLLENSTY